MILKGRKEHYNTVFDLHLSRFIGRNRLSAESMAGTQEVIIAPENSNRVAG